MKRAIKFLVSMVVTISLTIVILISWFIYQIEYKLTDIITYTAADNAYAVSFQMVGEPAWPFGPSTARIRVIKKIDESPIEVFTTKVHDDGLALQASNCNVTWGDSEVIITLTASEQADEVHIISLVD